MDIKPTIELFPAKDEDGMMREPIIIDMLKEENMDVKLEPDCENDDNYTGDWKCDIKMNQEAQSVQKYKVEESEQINHEIKLETFQIDLDDLKEESSNQGKNEDNCDIPELYQIEKEDSEADFPSQLTSSANPEEDSTTNDLTPTVPSTSSSIHQCEFCNFKAKTHSGKFKHLKALHSSQVKLAQLYKCSKCDFESMWRNSLRKHKRMEHQSADKTVVYRCNDCDFSTSYKESLKRHVFLHKKPEEMTLYQCEHCPYVTKWQCSMSKHKKVHSDPRLTKDYKCEKCSFETIWLNALRRHMVKKHLNPSKGTEYACKQCEFKSTNIRNFKSHEKVHSSGSNSDKKNMFVCPLCSFTSLYKYSLAMHMDIHKQEGEVDFLKCEYCSYQTRFHAALTKHQKTHEKHVASLGPENLPNFFCNSCGYVTRWKHALQRHLKMHVDRLHDAPTFSCEKCPFQTTHKPNLRYHMVEHHPSSRRKLHKCTLCPYASRDKGNFDKHLVNCSKHLVELPGLKAIQEPEVLMDDGDRDIGEHAVFGTMVLS